MKNRTTIQKDELSDIKKKKSGKLWNKWPSFYNNKVKEAEVKGKPAD